MPMESGLIFGADTSPDIGKVTVYFSKDFESSAPGKKVINVFSVTAGENKAGIIRIPDGSNEHRSDALNSKGLYIDHFFSAPISSHAVLHMCVMMPDPNAVPEKIVVKTEKTKKLHCLPSKEFLFFLVKEDS